MSRFPTDSIQSKPDQNGLPRRHRGRLDRSHLTNRNQNEEIDTETERHSSRLSHGIEPLQLRFFPHRFALPKSLLGVVTVIGGVLLIAALFFQVAEIFTPFLVAILAMIVLYPFRNEPKLRPVMVAGAVVFLIWFIDKSIMILLPFIIAFLLAYIAEPVVSKLQRRFYIKRWISALVVTLVLVAVLAVVAIYMTPILITQVSNALGSIDRVVAGMIEWGRSGGLAELTGLSQDKIDAMINRYVLPKTDGINDAVMDQAQKTAVALPGFLSSTFHFLAVPFIMFYIIKDYWHIRASIYSFIPKEYQLRSQRFLRDLDEVVGGFLRGDVITSIFQGTVIGIGLSVIGVPGALLLGVITGFLCLIPFIGGIIAYVLAAMAAISQPDPGITFLYVTLLFLGQSILESTVIGPQVMGRHTDLHPLLVIFVILIFGFFWGTVGMLVAIPVSGLLLRFAMRWRTKRHAEIELEKVAADVERNPHHARAGEEESVKG